MPKPDESHILKGFQNGEFRRALHSFLQEKCPEEMRGAEELPFEAGLKVIRSYILKRLQRPLCEPAAIA
jgi:hypothetical protein